MPPSRRIYVPALTTESRPLPSRSAERPRKTHHPRLQHRNEKRHRFKLGDPHIARFDPHPTVLPKAQSGIGETV